MDNLVTVACDKERLANQQLALERKQNTQFLEIPAVHSRQITELKLKANYYDVVLACKDLLPISLSSKDYGWSTRKMNKWLNKQGVQYKQGNIWLMYQKYAERGYTSIKTHIYVGEDGTPHTTIHTYWTQSGKLFIFAPVSCSGKKRLYHNPLSFTQITRITAPLIFLHHAPIIAPFYLLIQLLNAFRLLQKKQYGLRAARRTPQLSKH